MKHTAVRIKLQCFICGWGVETGHVILFSVDVPLSNGLMYFKQPIQNVCNTLNASSTAQFYSS